MASPLDPAEKKGRKNIIENQDKHIAPYDSPRRGRTYTSCSLPGHETLTAG